MPFQIPYRVVLAEDYIPLRQGLRRIIEETPNLDIVGEAGDGTELLVLLKKVTPDLIILDITMPNLRGISAASKIKTDYPDMKVLILSMHKKKEYLDFAIAAGADGYLLKEEVDTELFRAIEAIRQGGTYVSPVFSNLNSEP